MLVRNVIRGNVLTFTSVFYDAANNIVVPSSPSLILYYKSNNQYVTVTANLSQNVNSWFTTWDSSNADVGIVEWHITGGGNTRIASDGTFRVYANKANPGYGGS